MLHVKLLIEPRGADFLFQSALAAKAFWRTDSDAVGADYFRHIRKRPTIRGDPRLA